MRRSVITVLLLLTALTGCQTTLKSYKPGDTALLMTLDNERESGATPFGAYYAVLTNLATGKETAPIALATGEDVYQLEKGLAPGDYYLSQTYFKFRDNSKIPDEEREFFSEDYAPIRIEEGTITLCPVVFSTMTSRKSDLKLTVKMKLNVYKDKGFTGGDKSLKILQSKFPDDFATWKIQE